MLKSRGQMMSDMIGLLGGRAAEEIVFNDITSGASNDLERVTKLARTMVTRLGMSSELGPMVYGKQEELVFLGREISEQRDYSEHIAEKIDRAIQSLSRTAYEKAKTILTQYIGKNWILSLNDCWKKKTMDAQEFHKYSRHTRRKKCGIPVKI